MERLILIEGIGLKTDMKRGISAMAMLRKCVPMVMLACSVCRHTMSRHCADSEALSHKAPRKYASIDALLQVGPPSALLAFVDLLTRRSGCRRRIRATCLLWMPCA